MSVICLGCERVRREGQKTTIQQKRSTESVGIYAKRSDPLRFLKEADPMAPRSRSIGLANRTGLRVGSAPFSHDDAEATK